MSSSTVKPLTLSHPDGTGTIQFQWDQDRFDHEIRLGDASMRCFEQATDRAWPDSPPIQQLSIEPIEGRSVALGVGCAGTSHWSLSVEPIDGGFRFDWACRAKDAPVQLGSKYPKTDAIKIRANEGTRVSATDDLIAIKPDQEAEQAGTYRWRYDVLAS